MVTRTDERKQVGRGLHDEDDAERPNQDDDAAMDKEEQDEGLEEGGDEDGDEQNVTAPQGANQPDGYTRERMNEGSEERQKSGLMGQRGRVESSDGVKEDQEVSDSEEMAASAHKVLHGREKPAGEPAEISGAHQGSGHGTSPRHFTNLGHGEREATISGAHQGSRDAGKPVMEGFDACGSLRKEHARGSRGP
jgi:hypothetical protein